MIESLGQQEKIKQRNFNFTLVKESKIRIDILLMGKRSVQGIEMLHRLFKKPVVTIKDAQAMTGLSPKAANDRVKAFVEKKYWLKRPAISATGFLCWMSM